MKVSEIQLTDIANYLRYPAVATIERTYLENLLTISKNYIMSYTGLTADEVDQHPDFVIVVFALCQDMYDNRTLYVDNENLNRVVETILGMHSVNLL